MKKAPSNRLHFVENRACSRRSCLSLFCFSSSYRFAFCLCTTSDTAAQQSPHQSLFNHSHTSSVEAHTMPSAPQQSRVYPVRRPNVVAQIKTPATKRAEQRSRETRRLEVLAPIDTLRTSQDRWVTGPAMEHELIPLQMQGQSFVTWHCLHPVMMVLMKVTDRSLVMTSPARDKKKHAAHFVEKYQLDRMTGQITRKTS